MRVQQPELMTPVIIVLSDVAYYVVSFEVSSERMRMRTFIFIFHIYITRVRLARHSF